MAKKLKVDRVTVSKEGHIAAYRKGRPVQVVIDGRAWNVGLSKKDR